MLTTHIPSRERLGLAETDTVTFAGVTLGNFTIRPAVAGDVPADAHAAGNLLIYNDGQGKKVEYEDNNP